MSGSQENKLMPYGFGFAVIALIGGIALNVLKIDNNWPYILSGLSIIIAILGPAIEHFIYEKKGDDLNISFKRHVPTESERREIIEMTEVADKQEEISEEKTRLIENAKERPDQNRSPEDYLALATDAWYDKKFDEVLRYAFKGLDLDPKNIQVKATLLNLLGVVFMDMKNDPLAIQYYNEGIQADSKFPWPHYNLGVLYSGQKKYDEAEKAYRKAIELKADYAVAKENLEILLRERREKGE